MVEWAFNYVLSYGWTSSSLSLLIFCKSFSLRLLAVKVKKNLKGKYIRVIATASVAVKVKIRLPVLSITLR